MIPDLEALRRAIVHQEDVPPWLQPVLRPVQWAFVFYRALERDRAFVQAAGMAYISLVSLVPLALLVFAVLHATGVMTQLEPAIKSFVLESFLGDVPGMQESILPALLASDFGTLGLIGVFGLGFAAWRLYGMIEAAYSGIFGAPVDRPLLLRVLLFYVAVTVAPVILAESFLQLWNVFSGLGVGGGRHVAIGLLQFILLVGALKGFPSTVVRWGPALGGAAVSWLLLEGLGAGFQTYLAWFVEGDVVHVIWGSLGVLPIFLLYLYLAWVAVLVGVELASVAQNHATLFELEAIADHEVTWGARGADATVALLVAAAIGERFTRGEGPVTLQVLSATLGASERHLRPVITAMERAGLLVHASGAWVLTRAPDAIPLAEVLGAWRAGSLPLGVNHDLLQLVRHDVDSGMRGTLGDAMRRWFHADGTVRLVALPEEGDLTADPEAGRRSAPKGQK